MLSNAYFFCGSDENNRFQETTAKTRILSLFPQKKTANRSTICAACSYKPSKNDNFVTPNWLEEHNLGKEYTPSKNIAPTDVTPVVVSGDSFGLTCERAIKPMMWGMVPPWHKGAYNSHGLSTNNCRLESITNSKLYGAALTEGKRCVVIAEGFYEWKTTDNTTRTRQPYYIYSKQLDGVLIEDPNTWSNKVNLLRMAGVYNVWKSEDEGALFSYSILTMEANEVFSWLHHRVPAVLETDAQVEMWLNTRDIGGRQAVSQLKPPSQLQWHPVSTAVNNSRNKSDECNRRVELKRTTQPTLLTTWLTRKRRSDVAHECSEPALKQEKRPRHQ